MSSSRNIAFDQSATRALLDGAAELQMAPAAERPNWLGHSRTNADVDAALLLGATDAQLRALRSSWRSHKRHLLEKHGLFVANHGGLFRFAAIDPLDADDEVPELEPEAEYPDKGHVLLPSAPLGPQGNAVNVDTRQRFHGFVVLPRQAGDPAESVVHGDVPGALMLLNETAERTIFVITGPDKAAVAAAAAAVTLVWNHWVNGQPAATPPNGQVAPPSFVRDQGDWATPRQPAPEVGYVYEYRTQAADTFYVGRGKTVAILTTSRKSYARRQADSR